MILSQQQTSGTCEIFENIFMESSQVLSKMISNDCSQQILLRTVLSCQSKIRLLNFDILNKELPSYLQKNRNLLKSEFLSCGLTLSQPLEIELIIRDCFDNPYRKNHPEFKKNCDFKWSLVTQDKNPEYWIDLLNPELI